MKKLNLLFFTLLFVNTLYLEAQTQQALLNRTKHWRFGLKAGLDFNTTTGVPTVFNGSNGITYEGNSCISDTLGNLLFYCTGDTVWNRNHVMMLNGAGMKSDKITVLNSCIVPRPGNPNQYYLFVSECLNNNCAGGKLYSTLIDMTLDAGNGAVVAGQKNIVVMMYAFNSGTSFTKHANGIDYWLSYAERLPPYNTCMIKVTNTGADTATRVISSYDYGGFARFSPDGLIFATTGYQVYHFNNATGILSDEVLLATDSLTTYTPFSMEFSTNSKVLYFPLNSYTPTKKNLYQQFSLNTYNQTAINASMYSFYDNAYGVCFQCGITHSQLGLNGKIYIANNVDSIHIIHNPNALGAACNFQFQALSLNGWYSAFSLPIYPNYYFNNIPLLTSVNEQQLFNSLTISFFPNPCDESLTITHSILNNYTYNLYNTLGQLVYSSNSNQLFNQINTSLLPNGVYSFLSISSFGSQSKKIIINH